MWKDEDKPPINEKSWGIRDKILNLCVIGKREAPKNKWIL